MDLCIEREQSSNPTLLDKIKWKQASKQASKFILTRVVDADYGPSNTC